MTDNKKQTHVAEVVRHNGPIALPTKMTTKQAIDVLTRKLAYDDEAVVIKETIPVFVWDGALALKQALEDQFGLAMQQTEWTFFGPNPPQQIQIANGPGTTVSVPWGTFVLPGIEGKVQCAYQANADGQIEFQVVASIKHKDEDAIRELIARTRKIAMTHSIYRGRAIQIQFIDKNTSERFAIPKIGFPVLHSAPPIFSRELESAIDTNLLTPIRHADVARRLNIPLKRGCLLAGPYGTGKTLTAAKIARESIENGWTFIYVTEPDELQHALRFAQSFQPAVVFAEDVDRVAGLDRTDEVNQLLNTLDGIGNKSDEIITVLTSNHAEHISPAMKRPGRIDIVLAVEPPDAEAAERLVRYYAGAQLGESENLTIAGEMLAGEKPAVIREAVERAKLDAIRRTNGVPTGIEASDVEASARVLKAEQKLFQPAKALDNVERLGQSIGKSMLGVAYNGLPDAQAGHGPIMTARMRDER